MRFEFTFGASRSPQRREATPARILVVSDLRGHSAADPNPVSERPIVRVDIDNVEEVLTRCAPAVALGAEAGGERLQFRSFDDFHPDALVGTMSVFGQLLDLRRRLQHPDTFASAIAELEAERPPEPSVTPAAEAPSPESDDSRSTFERLLGQKAVAGPSTQQLPRVPGTIDNLIRRIVAPHVVPSPDPQVPQLLSAVDVAMGDLMRLVLHDPGFQEVEATWRGLRWLVSSLELGEDLELHLLHVTREELAQGVGPESDFYRRLVDREAGTAGGLASSVLVGNYRFGATPEDLALLESMGALARALDAPFVAESSASLLGTGAVADYPDPHDWKPLDPDFLRRWNDLRAAPVAPYLGLALPRVLLRLPYGSRSEPIEAFGFEELPPRPDHESFLWGNPAFACALVIARVLQPGSAPADPGELTGLPAFAVSGDAGPRLQPCAEVCLTERAADAILARGIMPLVSIKDRDAARLVRLQSVADPPTALGG